MDPDNMTTEGINDMGFASVMGTHDALMKGIATIKDQRDELKELVREMVGWMENYFARYPDDETPLMVLDFRTRARAILSEEGK